jgi:hypothetical protein
VESHLIQCLSISGSLNTVDALQRSFEKKKKKKKKKKKRIGMLHVEVSRHDFSPSYVAIHTFHGYFIQTKERKKKNAHLQIYVNVTAKTLQNET